MTVLIHELPNGDVIECDEYKITGKYYNSDRNFPAMHYRNFLHVKMINLWRGTVWGRDIMTDKWRKLWEVYN